MRTSYWVVPATMAALAGALSVVAVWLDRLNGFSEFRREMWLYGGSVDGARQLLSTLAASMITVTGVVFSVTIVVLSLASQQFGPRLLRNFITDLGNQLALGTFVGNFVFDLLVLSQVNEYPEGSSFVPRVSVTLGLTFSLLSAGVLIYFIHHMASSVQVETILDRVSRELDDAIERLYPETLGRDEAELLEREQRPQLPPGFEEAAAAVRAPASGYVQGLDTDALLALAVRENVLLRLERRPGDFVVQGGVLARLWPPTRADVLLLGKVASAFALGAMRTPTQDEEFGIQQFVQVACRALSPGINDPFTAIVCVDRLSAALSKVLGRRFPSSRRYDDRGDLRVVTDCTSFSGLMDEAFNQIRQAGADNVAVSIRLLEAFTRMKPFARTEEQRQEIVRHAHMVEAAIATSRIQSQDLKDVDARAKALDESA